jgi:hypothetical protein
MLGLTVGVDGVLSAADEFSTVAFDKLGLVEPNFADHDNGLIDVRSILLSSQFVSPPLSLSDSVDQVHAPVVEPLNVPQLEPTTSPRRREERLPFAGDQRMNG